MALNFRIETHSFNKGVRWVQNWFIGLFFNSFVCEAKEIWNKGRLWDFRFLKIFIFSRFVIKLKYEYMYPNIDQKV